MIWAPVEWQMTVPIKTPETNFWNSLLSRKPIDTSCFASDLQYIITLGSFFEIADTGVGLAHCPYYIPPLGIALSPAAIAADVIQANPWWHPCQPNNALPSTLNAGPGATTYTPGHADRWLVYTAPSGTPTGATDGTGIGLYITTQLVLRTFGQYQRCCQKGGFTPDFLLNMISLWELTWYPSQIPLFSQTHFRTNLRNIQRVHER